MRFIISNNIRDMAPQNKQKVAFTYIEMQTVMYGLKIKEIKRF